MTMNNVIQLKFLPLVRSRTTSLIAVLGIAFGILGRYQNEACAAPYRVTAHSPDALIGDFTAIAGGIVLRLSPNHRFTYITNYCAGTDEVTGRYTIVDDVVKLSGKWKHNEKTSERVYYVAKWRGDIYLLARQELFEFSSTVHNTKPTEEPSTYVGFLTRKGPGQIPPTFRQSELEIREPWLEFCRRGLPTGKVLYKFPDGAMAVDLGADHGLVRGDIIEVSTEEAKTEPLLIEATAPKVSIVKPNRLLARRVEIGETVAISTSVSRFVTGSQEVPNQKFPRSDTTQIVVTILLDVYHNKHHVWPYSFQPGSKIILDTDSAAECTTTSDKFIIADCRLIGAEHERLVFGKPENSFERVEMSQKYARLAFETCFPKCRTCIYGVKTAFQPGNKALVEFRMRLDNHGPASCTVGLSKRGGRWVITDRKCFISL